VLPISRRIERADGSFGGVVRASLSLDYFTTMLQNLDLGPHGEATIFKTDGVAIMRQPFRLFDIGKDASEFDLFAHLAAAKTGQFSRVSRTDGAERFYTYRRVGNLPLVVAVGAGADDVFAAWRSHAALLTLAMLGLLAGGAALFVLLKRELGGRQTAEARLAESARQLAVFAYSDGLTGLANRRRFDERLADESARARRSGEALSLLLVDVDHFKKYNDNHGHLAGDEALRRIGSTIQGILRRPADVAARFGGEEIAVLLPGTDIDGAMHVAEQMRGAVTVLDLQHPGGVDGRLTVSIGAASAANAGFDTELIAAADAALYRSKANGRDRVEAWTGSGSHMAA
jgi:diguanylate cyclase (GGDEF)-like protein